MNRNQKRTRVGTVIIILIGFVLGISVGTIHRQGPVEAPLESHNQPVTILRAVPIEIPRDRINFTNNELDQLQKLVMCEAGGENFLTQLLVASTIVNRVESDIWPDTLDAVINQRNPWQFTPVARGLLERTEASESVLEAVRLGLEFDYAKGCTVFNNGAQTPKNAQKWFETMELVYDIGNTQFRIYN